MSDPVCLVCCGDGSYSVNAHDLATNGMRVLGFLYSVAGDKHVSERTKAMVAALAAGFDPIYAQALVEISEAVNGPMDWER